MVWLMPYVADEGDAKKKKEALFVAAKSVNTALVSEAVKKTKADVDPTATAMVKAAALQAAINVVLDDILAVAAGDNKGPAVNKNF